MIVNIRGTNGSGKTTLMRQMMETYGYQPVLGEKGKHKGYDLNGIGTYVVGSYTANCGGCDTIKTQDESKARIREYASKNYNVLFEGVLISTIFGPWLEFSRANGGMVWAFLDTPLQLCLERIQRRNGGKPVKEDQVRSKWEGMLRIQEKARAAGEQVVVLNYTNAFNDLMAVMAPALLRKVA